jgi:hypothetical protein
MSGGTTPASELVSTIESGCGTAYGKALMTFWGL